MVISLYYEQQTMNNELRDTKDELRVTSIEHLLSEFIFLF